MVNNNRVVVFIPSLGGGGAEKIVLKLIDGFIKRGIFVELLLATTYGAFKDDVPDGVQVICFNKSKAIYSIFNLISYLNKNNPCVILSHLGRANRLILLACKLTRKNTAVHIVEHNTMSVALKGYSLLNRFITKLSYRVLYPRAQTIIHVSQAAANDFKKLTNLDENKIKVIYNPVVDKKMVSVDNYELPHPWFQSGNPPVILSVGRLTDQKDFHTLVNAFAIVKDMCDARLIILGEGHNRESLERLIDSMNLRTNVALPGFVKNPLAYMKYASLFVLSSRWEALPTVLIEAMSCGCPVVSTNCPSGPAEILEDGKIGILVPVQNPQALAKGIIDTMNNPISKQLLKNRARDFSVDNAVDKYIKILNL